MTTRDFGDQAWLFDFERLVGRAADGRVDPATHAAGRERLVRAVASGVRPGSPRWAYAVGAALTIAASFAVFSPLGKPTPDLRYSVGGQGVSEYGYVRGGTDAASRVSFSDGSEVSLFAGGRARVAALAPEGARLVLEGGHAHVDIVDLPRASWSVLAGPFTIQTSGALFDAWWSDGDTVLRVSRRGTLFLSGPAAPEGFALSAGQRLAASEGRFELEPLEISRR